MITRGQVFITRVTTDCKRVIMSYGKENKEAVGIQLGTEQLGGGISQQSPGLLLLKAVGLNYAGASPCALGHPSCH